MHLFYNLKNFKKHRQDETNIAFMVIYKHMPEGSSLIEGHNKKRFVVIKTFIEDLDATRYERNVPHDRYFPSKPFPSFL